MNQQITGAVIVSPNFQDSIPKIKRIFRELKFFEGGFNER